MIAHIMQALIVFILIAFPFAINFDDITLDNHSLNSTAVVDGAIIKHYSQTGSLPERLDAETLKKLGLNAEAVEGMEYKKLEDRKFELSYKDSNDNVNQSIHSNTLLPINTKVNSMIVEDEQKENNFKITVPKIMDGQYVTCEVKNGAEMIVLKEGETKTFPQGVEFNSKSELALIGEEFKWLYENNYIVDLYDAGIVKPAKGILNEDTIIDVSPIRKVRFGLFLDATTDKEAYDFLTRERFKLYNKDDRVIQDYWFISSDYPLKENVFLYVLKPDETVVVKDTDKFSSLVTTKYKGLVWNYNEISNPTSDVFIKPELVDAYFYNVSVEPSEHQTVIFEVSDRKGNKIRTINEGERS